LNKVSWASFARALRFCEDPSQVIKLRLILRGNSLVLLTVLVALLTDVVAVLLHPLSPSYWSGALLTELALMFLLVLCAALVLFSTFRRWHLGPSPRGLTLADGIDDLWTLVRVPITKAEAFLPRTFVDWVRSFDSDRAFAHTRWLHPRTHPWRFVGLLGVLAGFGLTLAEWREGPPPSLAIGVLVAAIFVGGELIASLVGFALLGGYLGLRERAARR